MLPTDILSIVVAYSTEPYYEISPLIKPSHKLGILSSSLHNPRAIKLIRRNWKKILCRSNLVLNPHPQAIKLIKTLYLTPNDIIQIMQKSKF